MKPAIRRTVKTGGKIVYKHRIYQHDSLIRYEEKDVAIYPITGEKYSLEVWQAQTTPVYCWKNVRLKTLPQNDGLICYAECIRLDSWNNCEDCETKNCKHRRRHGNPKR